MESASGWDWSATNNVPQAGSAAGASSGDTSSRAPRSENHQGSSSRRQYGPRTCRICLETEYPQFPEVGIPTLGVSTTSSKPSYVSDDPELGRLLSPCKCKGSQKYVHEGCLTAWRVSNPTAARNYWQCPTCKFEYRMTRLHWASALSSKWAQIAVTMLVILVSLYFLGYVADPVLDLWFDPVGTITDTVANVVTDLEGLREWEEEPTSWTEHFLKGFFSLGLVGMVKSFIVAPWQWWHIRNLGGGGRHGTGRDRYENMNLIFVLMGAFTFTMASWRFVRAMSTRVLQHVSDRVMDIDDDNTDEGPASDSESKKSI